MPQSPWMDGSGVYVDVVRTFHASQYGVRIPLKLRGGAAANRSGVHSALMDRSPNAAERWMARATKQDPSLFCLHLNLSQRALWSF